MVFLFPNAVFQPWGRIERLSPYSLDGKLMMWMAAVALNLKDFYETLTPEWKKKHSD